jgi:hypothetical protein
MILSIIPKLWPSNAHYVNSLRSVAKQAAT